MDRLEDKERYVRLCAAQALGGLGRAAAAALPVLREGLATKEESEVKAFREAIAAIESGKDQPDRERKDMLGRIREVIRRLPQGGGK